MVSQAVDGSPASRVRTCSSRAGTLEPALHCRPRSRLQGAGTARGASREDSAPEPREVTGCHSPCTWPGLAAGGDTGDRGMAV